MKSPGRPLRILAIVNLPWDSRLGASRVWIELAKEWTRAGHTVEKFCLTDAYPRGIGFRRQVGLATGALSAKSRGLRSRNMATAST